MVNAKDNVWVYRHVGTCIYQYMYISKIILPKVYTHQAQYFSNSSGCRKFLIENSQQPCEFCEVCLLGSDKNAT